MTQEEGTSFGENLAPVPVEVITPGEFVIEAEPTEELD